jgi:DNA polymerase III epsilon subunit-like protein
MTSSVPAILAGRDLVVVDVEGNGQNPPEIVEFAALPVNQAVDQAVDQAVGQTVSHADLRSWLIRPQKPIAPMVTRTVHGIRNADVADCPRWPDVAPEIAQLLAGRVLVAHGAHVEYRVIGAHLPDWTPPMVLDTVRLAKYVWPSLGSYSLTKLAEHAALDLAAVADQQPHRAAYDTWCAWQLLRVLVDDGDIDWPGLLRVATLPGSIAPTQSAQRAEPEGGLW